MVKILLTPKPFLIWYGYTFHAYSGALLQSRVKMIQGIKKGKEVFYLIRYEPVYFAHTAVCTSGSGKEFEILAGTLIFAH